jgi:predicted esterase
MTFGSPAAEASEVWFGFHGYGQLAPRFASRLSPLDDGRRLIVVPEGLSRFYVDAHRGIVGASWMTREDRLHEIDDYVAYLDHLAAAILPTPTPPVHVLGFSQGSATACRWVERGAIRPVRVVIWGGEIPPDLDWTRAGERFRDLEMVLVAGDRDEFATPEALERHETVLRGNGVRYRTVRYDGGHSIDEAVLAGLAR